ncbi:zinc transporter ZIP3 [Condylostylus longicornis]|uniref:zinc transporter ZIP3 n=1 Tax=Condylostylus longicornis TaxID=2530218 RepID=UPI00244DFD9F|nr:zinc transporter ZIP3 [Condylostylus longicornis]XP_055375238.1 zinc transporter ZIP3 [Condylostylus longicornis]
MEESNIVIMSNATAGANKNATSNLNDFDPDFAIRYKILAMFVLGVGSLVAGILPRLISYGQRKENFFISLMLCFGGGVLLATALVHILVDVRKDMSENAEVYLCLGFFVIYFIDEFIHYFFGEALQHMHDNSENDPHETNYNHYGTSSDISGYEYEALLNNGASHSHHQPGETCDADEGNARICYTSHDEPCAETRSGALGLVTALSIHSIIEGLAIGLQNTSAGVMVLFLAVACHKYVMSFCLGLEIRMTSNSNIKKHLLAVTIFSLGSVIGIAIGMALDGIPTEWSKSAFPILQALAGGTLLYVTVCEVLPRERARWHQNPTKRYAGIAQFLSVGFGFAAMSLVEHFLEH